MPQSIALAYATILGIRHPTAAVQASPSLMGLWTDRVALALSASDRGGDLRPHRAECARHDGHYAPQPYPMPLGRSPFAVRREVFGAFAGEVM